jgi:uncharacterized protein (PEP-CTERM system associated)
MRELGAWAAWLLVVSACFTAPAISGEWRISPSVGLFESFTDNADLSPPGQQRWDFVTNIEPAISIHGEGSRFSLDLDASLNGIIYARDGSLDGVDFDLTEANRTELVEDMLFIDTRAVVTQLAPQPGQAVSGSTASSQQGTTVATLLASPYLRDHFGSFADSEVRYTFGQVVSGSSDIANSTTNELSAQLVSGTQFSRFRWTLTGDAAYTLQGSADAADGGGASGSRNILHLLAQADAEYALSRQWALLAGFGYERIRDATLDDQPNGPIGDVGFRWRPGPRLGLTLQFNHRFDKNYPSGALSYRIGAATLLTASYSEGIQTTQGLLAEDVGFLSTDEAGNFIDTRTEQLFSLSTNGLGFNNSSFLQQQFAIDLSSTFDRDRVAANGYYIRQHGARDVDEVGYGGSFGWTHDLNEDDQAGATVRYQHVTSQSSDREIDNTVGVALSVSHKFSNTLRGVVLYSFVNQFSSNNSNRFRENVLSVGLVKAFE